MAEIQAVIDQIVILQKAVPTPTNEKDIQEAYDEPPDSVGVFPCFLNVEESGEQEFPSGNWGYLIYTVNMHLLFAPATQKYSIRSRRKWVKPVLKHFRENVSLNNTAAVSWVANWDHNPVEWNGMEYIAATFNLRVKAQEDWA